MQKIINNLLLVIGDRRSMAGFAIAFVLVWVIIYSMTNYPLIRGNMWNQIYYLWVVIDILFVLLFSFFVAGFVYKSLLFSTYKNVWWRFGWFLGVLVTWCTSCSISIASYLGIAWLISLLPWWGIELKIIWLLLVIYWFYNTFNKLTECKIKKK